MADKALLMGINDFRSISDLRGCLNDVDNMQRLLTETCGFKPGNIVTLKEQEVVKKAVKREMGRLFQKVTPGDRVLLHLSSHGSYTVDVDGDEDEDRVDELFCLYDMDWDNPDSYILDDEFREWTKKLPDGVQLTVILDTCHSGTGTRQIRPPDNHLPEEKLPWVDERATLERKIVTQTRGMRSLQEADLDSIVRDALTGSVEDDVIARFVQPPSEIVEEAQRLRPRGAVRPRSPQEMNHVLLAACRSDQTAADARIDGTFNGAFTFHLCRAVREAAGRVEHQDLIGLLSNSLREGRFAQIPQLEPDGARGLFLGGKAVPGAAPSSSATSPPAAEPPAAGSVPSGPTSTSEPTPISLETGHTPASSGSAVLAGNEEGRREILELLARIVNLLEGRSGAEGERRGARQIVYVHGICRHDRGYSDGWWRSLDPFAPSVRPGDLEGNRWEVLWSDLVNRVRALEDLGPEQQEVQQRLEDTLADRMLREVAHAQPEGTRDMVPPESSAPRALLGIPGLDCIDDFTRYLLSDRVRRDVLARFDRVVRPLLERGAEIEVVSHSWGTVVAYEALLELDRLGLPGAVRNFFTVGSALSIPEVKRRLREGGAGRKPRLVRRWINLDARGDVVGGPLKGNPFDVDHEFLNLEPVGCGRWMGLPGTVDPACAHSSYFGGSNRAVNAEIFGRFIER